MYSVIKLNDQSIFKGEYVEWNEYGLVMKNIVELVFTKDGENVSSKSIPSIYPPEVHVCFDRHFIISEYQIEK